MRTSMLQVSIMQALQATPGQSLTDIAARLGTFRSAVSRSMHTLHARGLVTREDRAWDITAAGITEFERATASLKKHADRARRLHASVEPNLRLAARLLDAVGPQMDALAGAQRAMAGHAQDVINSALAPLQESSAQLARTPTALDLNAPQLGVADEALRVTAERMTASAKSMLAPLQEPLASLVRTQAAHAALTNATIEQAPDARVFRFTRECSRHLASAVDSTFAIHEALRPAGNGFKPLLTSEGVLRHFSAMTSTLQPLIDEAVSQLLSEDNESTVPTIPALLAPPVTASTFAHSLRLTVTNDSSSAFYIEPDPGEYSAELDDRLAGVEPRFAEMHRGAWDVLRAGGPDHPRQAAVSMRELILGVFKHLVPDVVLDADSQRNLQARLRHVLRDSKSGSAFVTHQALALEVIYRQYSAYVNGDKRETELLRALLLSTDGLLLYVLVMASNDEPLS